MGNVANEGLVAHVLGGRPVESARGTVEPVGDAEEVAETVVAVIAVGIFLTQRVAGDKISVRLHFRIVVDVMPLMLRAPRPRLGPITGYAGPDDLHGQQ